MIMMPKAPGLSGRLEVREKSRVSLALIRIGIHDTMCSYSATAGVDLLIRPLHC